MFLSPKRFFFFFGGGGGGEARVKLFCLMHHNDHTMKSTSGHTVLHLLNSKISTEKRVTSVYIVIYSYSLKLAAKLFKADELGVNSLFRQVFVYNEK